MTEPPKKHAAAIDSIRRAIASREKANAADLETLEVLEADQARSEAATQSAMPAKPAAKANGAQRHAQ